MVVAEQVQEAVEGQHAELGPEGMPRLPRLPIRPPRSNDDVAERPGLSRGRKAPARAPRPPCRPGFGPGGERQHVRHAIDSGKPAIQAPHDWVGHEGDDDQAASSGRRNRLEPRASPPACRRPD
jgi:hypothetical protein